MKVCRRLLSVLTIGPFASTALVATIGDPHYFSSGRHFAAWLGLVPKQHSTAGRERLGGISKRGDSYVRKFADSRRPIDRSQCSKRPSQRSVGYRPCSRGDISTWQLSRWQIRLLGSLGRS
ncbi:transposase [Mesorhizobium sp. Root172]|uniref:transposase n=1 Tax=Mesorhizobium sp. Root172 TaxID=1736481 RepID=UPI0009EAD9D3